MFGTSNAEVTGHATEGDESVDAEADTLAHTVARNKAGTHSNIFPVSLLCCAAALLISVCL